MNGSGHGPRGPITLLRATILTEAGSSIGLGHLTRCVALYDALESVGVECTLVVSGEAPLHVVGSRRVHERDWLDPRAAVECLAGADCAVVDSYRATPSVYGAMAERVAVAVYLDDTSRLEYPHGIIVNGMPDAARLLADDDRHTLLLGTRYQVLRREFWTIPTRHIHPIVRRVLVVSGGTDAAGTRDAMAQAAKAAYPDAIVDVVDAARDSAAMLRAMSEADVAVSTAGQTLYELAATGTPTVALSVADNQTPQARALEHAGVLRLAGSWPAADATDRITRHLSALAGAEARHAMSAAGQNAVDGQGALRVARRCVGAVVEQRLQIGPAVVDDEADLLELANDPSVRGMSFTAEPITADGHHKWLLMTLRDSARVLLVARDQGRLVGQVRFDLATTTALIGISVGPHYRGLGLAETLLEKSISVLRAAHPEIDVVEARVKPENAASRALFERGGFALDPGAPAEAPGALRYVRSICPEGGLVA